MKKTIFALALFLFFVFIGSGMVYAAEDYAQSLSVSSLSVYTYPNKTVYGAFEKLDTTGLSLKAVYTDGSEKIISGSDIQVVYRQDTCLRVGDDSVLLSYGGRSLYLPITVNRIAYDLSSLDLTPFTTVYNGLFQTYSKPIPQIVGLDGIPLRVTPSGGGILAGVYDISLDFSSESKDYFTPESRVVSMTVEQATAEIIWENLSFVYDGKSKLPTAYYIDVNGARVYPTVYGGATNAGLGYIARVMISDPNYKFTNTTSNYEIKKADYDFSGVSWSAGSFTYDGSKKSVSASGLPTGVSIIGYSGDRGSDAGIYTATALLKWDELNYNSPPPLTHTWEIKQASYDLSGVIFKAESFVYDGNMHYPILVGAMPIGSDGIKLEYSFSDGACHVDDGVVSVIISFHTASKNYIVPDDMHSSVSITAKGIEVRWGNLNLVYNGEEQIPTAVSEDCQITVSGKATDTGKYIATASASSNDYYIINEKMEFNITKAQNYWVTSPKDSVCYEGREIKLIGESKFGVISVRYYSDFECKNEIAAPTTIGKYYAAMSVDGTSNYDGLDESIIAFEIVEVLPISFLAGIVKKDIKAFTRLEEGDFVCSVLNNDGSVVVIDSGLVTVIYENGDSFRKKDKSVKLQYKDFFLTLSVDVGYADYDLSSVKWSDTTQIYDGTAKTPVINGLPDGVSVTEYTINNMINAGEYSVNVKFDYDSDNYNEPIVSPCVFTIEKCPVNLPIITGVYNGTSQVPSVNSSVYYISSTESFINSGKYAVEVSLLDAENYVFAENNSSVGFAIFHITPAILTVKVSDVRLKLFEGLKHADYQILSGEVYDGDSLNVYVYREGKDVKIRSENPNYILNVQSGKIIRLPYPTFNGAVIIFLCLASCLIISVFGIRIFRSRHRIIGAVAMAKCKWHNRSYKAPPPRESREMSSEDRGDKGDLLFSDEDDGDENAEIRPAETDGDQEEVISLEINLEKADALITDSLAKSLIKREGEMVCTDGSEKASIEVGLLSKSFSSGDTVDVNSLKEKGLVSKDVAYIKIVGGGVINKPLLVYANDFSLSAVKMIALSGGQAIKIFTFKGRTDREKG